MATLTSYRTAAVGHAAGLMFSCALLVGPVVAAASATVDTAGTAAQWHAQKIKFAYTGFTAFYTCDGLESKVRDILLNFGARKDVKVRTTGCEREMNKPSRFAWVATEFSSLAPASDTAASDIVEAAWGKVEVEPNRPWYMGMGECELVEQMRPLLEKGFALRNEKFHTSCVPNQISVGDYGVRAEVLRPVAH